MECNSFSLDLCSSRNYDCHFSRSNSDDVSSRRGLLIVKTSQVVYGYVSMSFARAIQPTHVDVRTTQFGLPWPKTNEITLKPYQFWSIRFVTVKWYFEGRAHINFP